MHSIVDLPSFTYRYEFVMKNWEGQQTLHGETTLHNIEYPHTILNQSLGNRVF